MILHTVSPLLQTNKLVLTKFLLGQYNLKTIVSLTFHCLARLSLEPLQLGFTQLGNFSSNTSLQYEYIRTF